MQPYARVGGGGEVRSVLRVHYATTERCELPADPMRGREWRKTDLWVFAVLSMLLYRNHDLVPRLRPVAAFCVPPTNRPLSASMALRRRGINTGQHRSIHFASSKSTNIEDHDTLMRICMSHFTAQALNAFCRLGIHHILQQQSTAGRESNDDDNDNDNNSFLSLDAITNILQEQHEEQFQKHNMVINKDALLRTLRLLVADGILQEHPESSGFALTSVGALLQQDDSMVRHWTEAPLWNAWAALPDYILSNNNKAGSNSSTPQSPSSPFEAANGVSSNVYYGQNKESLQHANNLVRYIANEEIGVCVNCIDWAHLLEKNRTTVVDVGGHRGDVMRAVAARNPDARCICLDLASVVEDAEPLEGVELVAGDLFEPSSFPSECDIIFMKHIVFCELDDTDWIRALKSCYTALPEHGRLIIAEAALPDPGSASHDPLSLKMDAFMLLVGRESAKTHSQWKAAASEAGFRLVSIQKTHMPTCSILQFVKQ